MQRHTPNAFRGICFLVFRILKLNVDSLLMILKWTVKKGGRSFREDSSGARQGPVAGLCVLVPPVAICELHENGSKSLTCFHLFVHNCHTIWCNVGLTYEVSGKAYPLLDRLCGLVVRVSGYRYRGLGFDSRRYQIFWVVEGLERGPLSFVRSIGELLE